MKIIKWIDSSLNEANKILSHTTNGNVFDDLKLNQGEALNLKIRSVLMNEVAHYIQDNSLTEIIFLC